MASLDSAWDEAEPTPSLQKAHTLIGGTPAKPRIDSTPAPPPAEAGAAAASPSRPPAPSQPSIHVMAPPAGSKRDARTKPGPPPV
ncbi:MAG TPA: hypothetical protein VHB21_22365, partial [Minicystis sp.]|nr:hypothetical protein [Minicystis sp.]